MSLYDTFAEVGFANMVASVPLPARSTSSCPGSDVKLSYAADSLVGWPMKHALFTKGD